jgi:hypothetical protein
MWMGLFSIEVAVSQIVRGKAWQSPFVAQPGKQEFMLPALRRQKFGWPSALAAPKELPAHIAEVVQTSVHHPPVIDVHVDDSPMQLRSETQGSPRPTLGQLEQLFWMQLVSASHGDSPEGNICAQLHGEVAQLDSHVRKLTQAGLAWQALSSLQQEDFPHATHGESLALLGQLAPTL